MMADEIVLLGTKGGPAIRQGGAMPTASLLRFAGQNILIDCGIGVARSLVEAGVSLLDIDAIFITHLHSDHVLELGPLIYTAWTTGLRRSLRIYGPRGTDAYWQNFLRAMAFDHAIRIADEGRPDIAELVTIGTIDDGWSADLNGLLVQACRVDHPPVTDCFALRFAHADKAVVFSADTCFYPPLAAFAAGADVLVHEAMLLAGLDKLIQRTPGAARLRAHLMASHTPAADVGRIATEARVGTLVLNHLIPADDPDMGPQEWQAELAQTWHGPLLVGHDGLRVRF